MSGLFSQVGCRGRNSAEARCLQNEELAAAEIYAVLNKMGTSVVVTTTSGATVVLTGQQFLKLLPELVKLGIAVEV